jgi:3-deoxy-D-arabino-heptulosonate 7-phosphate (DAHP) synthase
MTPETPNEKTTPKQPKRKKGETLDEKVQRHLKDKNDVITEEDLRDVVIKGITSAEEEKSEELADQLDELSKNKKTTPWDILDEEQ